MVISAEEYQEIKARHVAFEAWRNGSTSYRPEEIPAGTPITTNDDLSAMEAFEFVRDKPNQYFLYINWDKKIATTWTGDYLGKVIEGKAWRDNFGGMRVAIRIVDAVNGVKYSGTYFKSAGDYARVKAVK